MVAEMKDEYLAAGIRRQIESLNKLSEEIQLERLTGEALSWRIRAVELQLRQIREAA